MLNRDNQGGEFWRVSWNIMATMIAASDSSNNITLWKNDMDDKWNEICQI